MSEENSINNVENTPDVGVPKTAGQSVELDQILDLCVDLKASDLHFGTNEKIALRINGKIRFIENIPVLTKESAENLIYGMVKNPLHKDRLVNTRELDFAYQHKDGTNFRVNVYFKKGCIAVAMRAIGRKNYTLEELGIPPSIKELMKKKQGLILVTGPTGSGKSTSMQAMLSEINETRVEHILTIEDPIEFVFESKKCIFSQREIGEDTLSFPNALRASLREDPDVIMIGEMRDKETISAALNLSETGHLVISTLHTSGGPETVHRLINSFPPEEQHQTQSRLADTLVGVLSQRLVPRIDADGRIAIFEVLLVNSAVRNVIRTGEVSQLSNAMIAGRSEGMIAMHDYADELAAQGIISENDYVNFFKGE